MRGWLAYADPLFAFFTFGAMACLWVATSERRVGLLALAALALVCAFLAKVLTAYVFYGVFGLVLLWRHRSHWSDTLFGGIAGVVVGISGGVSVAVFLGMATILKIEELRWIAGLLARRLGIRR